MNDIIKDTAMHCVYIIQNKLLRNGKTPENLRTMEHVEDIKKEFYISTEEMNQYNPTLYKEHLENI